MPQGQCTLLADDAGVLSDHARTSDESMDGRSGELGKEQIEKALAANKGNVSAAARDLGIKHKTTLYRRMEKLGIKGSGAEEP